MYPTMIRTQAVAKAGTKVSSGATNKVKAKKPARNRAQRPVLAPASIPTALSRIAVEVGVPMKPAPIVAIESEIRARSSPGILPLLSMKPARKDKPIKVDMLSNKSTIVIEKSTPTIPTVSILLKSTWKMVSVGRSLKSVERRL